MFPYLGFNIDSLTGTSGVDMRAVVEMRPILRSSLPDMSKPAKIYDLADFQAADKELPDDADRYVVEQYPTFYNMSCCVDHGCQKKEISTVLWMLLCFLVKGVKDSFGERFGFFVFTGASVISLRRLSSTVLPGSSGVEHWFNGGCNH
uniref:Inorganic diphosphatase n=1 Tax=Angiostrongylus cantonensis TaxID=6313 RepID=A0A0K0CT34_ANGCA